MRNSRLMGRVAELASAIIKPTLETLRDINMDSSKTPRLMTRRRLSILAL